MKQACSLYCVLFLIFFSNFAITYNEVLGGTGLPSATSTSVQNYGIKEGQWVKYGPLKIEVNSDNSFLKLMLKGMMANGWPFSESNSVSPLGVRSINDIDWLLLNISRISGNEVTTEVTAKSKLSQNVSSPFFTNPIAPSNNNGIYSLFLPKNTKIGDTILTSFNNEDFPLTINNTLQKKYGNRIANGYEASGTINRYNETSGLASEITIYIFFDKFSGRPLEISFKFEAGTFFATAKFNAKISAIDWSN